MRTKWFELFVQAVTIGFRSISNKLNLLKPNRIQPSNSIKSLKNGFTLLEMLVALAIFSLAALALIRLQAFTTSNAADIQLRVIAQSVVRNRAVEILTAPQPPTLGKTSGEESNGGIDWNWTQEAQMTEDGRFVEVALTARDPFGRTGAGLTILRPAGTLIELPNADPDLPFGGETGQSTAPPP